MISNNITIIIFYNMFFLYNMEKYHFETRHVLKF